MVIKLRLADYSFTNSLLNAFQSAYIKHHFTETSLCSWSYYQSYESSKWHLIHTSWLICYFWYRSLYSSWTSFILVWHFFYCSLLNQILFIKPFFLSILKTLNHLYANFFMKILKDSSVVIYASSYIHPSALIFHSLHIVLLGLPLLLPLVALLSPLILKLQTNLSIICSCFVEQSTNSHLIYVTLIIMSLLHYIHLGRGPSRLLTIYRTRM